MSINRETLVEWVQHFSAQQIVVVGDVILDEYLIGKATRISREAPIPVLEFESRREIPGGAANPAVNIAALGARAAQVGVIGADHEGGRLRAALEERGVQVGSLLVNPEQETTVKTRVMAQMGLRFPQQVARLDRLPREPLSVETETLVAEMLAAELPTASAVLFSDYQLGLNTPAVIRASEGAALRVADTQGSFDKYAGFDALKCNADEAQAYLRRDLESEEDFAEAARELFAMFGLKRCMVITRGALGATLATADETHLCPAPAISEVYDTVGAGDTSVAVMALTLAAGASPEAAVTLANIASGLVVQRVGNYAPSASELITAIRGEAGDKH